MISCDITGISQEMDFEKSVTVTYLVLRLPGGALVRAAIDEEVAATLVELQVRTNGAPTPAVRPHPMPTNRAYPPQEPASDDGEENYAAASEFVPAAVEGNPDTHIFGGQAGTPMPEEEAQPPAPEPAPPPVREVPNSLTKPRGKANARGNAHGDTFRTVPKNDRGYPVLQNAGVDTSTITGSHNQDEDGVGSV